MKTLATLVFIIVSAIVSHAQTTEGVTLKVTVNNVHNTKGKVIFSLHTQETFLKGKGVQNAEAEIKDGIATVNFTNVKPGTYAIIALHDENNNNRMDFDGNGMPLEDYGASNNIMSFGPPSFADAKFEVAKEDKELNIRF